jgi:hypothetical protein
MEGFQDRFEFILPKGYKDDRGRLHRKGVMRLATAADEIQPLRDPRVKANEAYLVVILLARVVTKLGDLSDVDTGIIEGLYSADLAFLQDFYRRINEDGTTAIATKCPSCEHEFQVDLSRVGGS